MATPNNNHFSPSQLCPLLEYLGNSLDPSPLDSTVLESQIKSIQARLMRRMAQGNYPMTSTDQVHTTGSSSNQPRCRMLNVPTVESPVYIPRSHVAYEQRTEKRRRDSSYLSEMTSRSSIQEALSCVQKKRCRYQRRNSAISALTMEFSTTQLSDGDASGSASCTKKRRYQRRNSATAAMILNNMYS